MWNRRMKAEQRMTTPQIMKKILKTWMNDIEGRTTHA